MIETTVEFAYAGWPPSVPPIPRQGGVREVEKPQPRPAPQREPEISPACSLLEQYLAQQETYFADPY